MATSWASSAWPRAGRPSERRAARIRQDLPHERREGVRRDRDGSRDVSHVRQIHRETLVPRGRSPAPPPETHVFCVEEVGSEREVRPVLLHRTEREKEPPSFLHRLGELVARQSATRNRCALGIPSSRVKWRLGDLAMWRLGGESSAELPSRQIAESSSALHRPRRTRRSRRRTTSPV